MVVQVPDFGHNQKTIKQNNLSTLVDGALFEKTLDRVKASIYDYPIISTNFKYLKKVKSYLKKFKVKKYTNYSRTS